MKATEVITLIGAGYSIGEIKEMDNVSTVIELLKGGVKKDDMTDALSLLQEQEAEESKEETAEEEVEEKEDYEKKYYDLLKEQQKNNASKDISGEDTEDAKKLLEDIVRDFM